MAKDFRQRAEPGRSPIQAPWSGQLICPKRSECPNSRNEYPCPATFDGGNCPFAGHGAGGNPRLDPISPPVWNPLSERTGLSLNRYRSNDVVLHLEDEPEIFNVDPREAKLLAEACVRDAIDDMVKEEVTRVMNRMTGRVD